MAAFAISFDGLTRGNIRNIYSYKPTHFFTPSPRPFAKTTQFLPRPLVERFPPRFYDYYPTFQTGLPRAPAFNRLSPEEVRAMVERITKPTACQSDRRRPNHRHHRRHNRSQENEDSRKKDTKTVRFVTTPPPPGSQSEEGAASTTAAPTTKTDPENCNRSGDKKQHEEKRSKNSSNDKVKSDKLPDIVNEKNERAKKKKSTARLSRKSQEMLTLPPIQ